MSADTSPKPPSRRERVEAYLATQWEDGRNTVGSMDVAVALGLTVAQSCSVGRANHRREPSRPLFSFVSDGADVEVCYASGSWRMRKATWSRPSAALVPRDAPTLADDFQTVAKALLDGAGDDGLAASAYLRAGKALARIASAAGVDPADTRSRHTMTIDAARAALTAYAAASLAELTDPPEGEVEVSIGADGSVTATIPVRILYPIEEDPGT